MKLKVIKNMDEMTLKEQQKFVCGCVEYIRLNIGGVMIVNDMPKRLRENINYVASLLYSMQVGYRTTIYGNVLIVTECDAGEQ